MTDINDDEDRELRVINRNFSLGEYGESWSKMERYLFIEIYDTIKRFFMGESDENIVEYGSTHITIKISVKAIKQKFFKGGNKRKQLLDVAESLSQKKISMISIEDSDQYGFDFITIFPRISYNPLINKNDMYVEIHNSVYEEMVPIESFCQLDLKLLGEFNSGNTIRLYEIFKSYAFRKSFDINFNDLRKKLGFFNEGSYEEWKYFNAKVLKPAVQNINSYKEYDIEVFYEKSRGLDRIEFKIKTHKVHDARKINVLNLNEKIDPDTRTPNLIQQKYLNTLVSFCKNKTKITNEVELINWIISDLINQQLKSEEQVDFKRMINEISKQIRMDIYTQPYSHQYLGKKENTFDPVIYEEIKKMELKGEYELIKTTYTEEQIYTNHFGFIFSS